MLQKYRPALFALFLLPPTVINAQIPGDTLTLDLASAIKIAQAKSPVVKMGDLSVTKQRYADEQAIAALFPQVDASVDYSYTLKKSVMYLSLPGMKEPRGIEMGRTHNIRAGIRAGMPLVAPQLWESISMSRQQLELSVEKARSSRIDLLAEVSKAYLAALLAEESYTVFLHSYRNAEENYRNIEEKFTQGLVADYDRLRAKIQVKNLEPSLLQAENESRLALQQLKIVMGIDSDQPVRLTKDPDSYPDEGMSRIIPDTDAYSLEGNSILRQMALQDTLLHSAERLKARAFIPTLNLGFAYDYSYMNDRLTLNEKMFWSPHSVISLSLSVPIFSGGKRYYGLKESKTDRLLLRLQRDDTRRKLTLAVIRQQDQMLTASKRFAAASDAATSAERGCSIARKRYETGIGTILELNDADLQLLQARLNRARAFYDLMVGRAELNRLQGIEPVN